jgi:hypothetical protein
MERHRGKTPDSERFVEYIPSMIRATEYSLNDPSMMKTGDEGKLPSCGDTAVENQSIQDARSIFHVNPTRKFPRISPINYQAQVIDSTVIAKQEFPGGMDSIISHSHITGTQMCIHHNYPLLHRYIIDAAGSMLTYPVSSEEQFLQKRLQGVKIISY